MIKPVLKGALTMFVAGLVVAAGILLLLGPVILGSYFNDYRFLFGFTPHVLLFLYALGSIDPVWTDQEVYKLTQERRNRS